MTFRAVVDIERNYRAAVQSGDRVAANRYAAEYIRLLDHSIRQFERGGDDMRSLARARALRAEWAARAAEAR